MKALVVFTETDIGLDIDDISWNFCTGFETGTNNLTSAQYSASLIELGRGLYTIDSPALLENSAFSIYITAAPTKIYEGFYGAEFLSSEQAQVRHRLGIDGASTQPQDASIPSVTNRIRDQLYIMSHPIVTSFFNQLLSTKAWSFLNGNPIQSVSFSGTIDDVGPYSPGGIRLNMIYSREVAGAGSSRYIETADLELGTLWEDGTWEPATLPPDFDPICQWGATLMAYGTWNETSWTGGDLTITFSSRVDLPTKTIVLPLEAYYYDAAAAHNICYIIWTPDLRCVCSPTPALSLTDMSEDFTRSMTDLASKRYSGGGVAIPETGDSNFIVPIFANTDYEDLAFILGQSWRTKLEDPTYEFWFTVKVNPRIATSVIDVKGAITDLDRRRCAVDLTSAQTNITPGEYFWQAQLRKPAVVGPPAIPAIKHIVLEGKLLMKPTFKG